MNIVDMPTIISVARLSAAFQAPGTMVKKEPNAEREKAAIAKGGGRKIVDNGMKIRAEPKPANP